VPGDPDAAFVKLNNAFDPDIPTVVAAGYIVRTRADADTVESRTGDTALREAALASGAQFVSTDYPVPDPDFTDYFVQIPGGTPGGAIRSRPPPDAGRPGSSACTDCVPPRFRRFVIDADRQRRRRTFSLA
jgi:hypothetical protein